MVESQRAFPQSWARWRLQNYSIYQVQRHFFPTIFCARGKRWWFGGCGERSINVLSSRLGPYQSCHHHYLSPTLVIPPLPFLSQYLIQLQKELSTIPSLQCAPYCTCLDIKTSQIMCIEVNLIEISPPLTSPPLPALSIGTNTLLVNQIFELLLIYQHNHLYFMPFRQNLFLFVPYNVYPNRYLHNTLQYNFFNTRSAPAIMPSFEINKSVLLQYINVKKL